MSRKVLTGNDLSDFHRSDAISRSDG